MDDPNLNPLWDAYMGDNTNAGVVRMVIGIAAFVAAGATVFWLIG
jgi:hypothetical protein